MIRPSVNQITSAYTGRMPALQEQVEKDKQANNGIPSDLRKLMALQDLLSDGKHMGIDQALKAPQNPATVSQSLQDRARQILQARMAQAQQSNAIAQKQQEAMVNQGRPGPVPQGIAQPERQPEGIDQLESNVGESYANGGIVAFNEGGYGKWLRDTFYSNITDAEKKRKEELEAAVQPASKEASAKQTAISKRLDEERARNMAEVINPTPEGDPRRLRAPKGESVSTAEEDAALAAAAQPKPTPKPQITKTTDKPSIANLPAVADLLPPALPTPEKGSPRDVMGKSMTLDPDAEMNRILAAREKLVGAPDTSQYQALIEELRGQKAKLQKKPEPGFESLMEYFGEIAAGPTVGRSGKAGAMASERLRQRELDKEKQANALSERMIEAAQKQQDAVYGYKKEGFALSETERARVFKERFDAAKAAGESDDRARTLGQQAVLEREKMKQQAELERERNAVTIRAAGIGAANRRGELMELAESLMKADTTGKLTLEAALEKAARIKGTVATSGQNVRSIADYQKAKKEIEALYPPYMREGTGKTAVAQKKLYDAAMAELKKDYGIEGGAGLNSLPTAIPPGVTVTQTSAK
jgi:hypothetical protein